MFGPENESGDADAAGEIETAVVVDLTKEPEKQEVPLEAVKGEPSGDEDLQRDTRGAREESGEGDSDEFRSTGRKDFDKRLKREMRAKVQARSEAAAAAQEAERLRQENEQLRAQRETREEPSTSDLDSKITDAQAALEKAIEDGDSKAQARLHTEIADLASQRRERLSARRAAPQQQRQQPTQQQRPKGPTQTGRAFIAANVDWWNDPEQAAARAAIEEIDSSLIRNGSDPNSERHYERIARRAKEMGLRVKIRQPFDDGDLDGEGSVVDLDEREQRRERRQPPQGGNGNSRQRVDTSARDARAGKIVITEDDKKVMQQFKLDPTNPVHMRSFAKSRQERILQESNS